MSKLKLVTTEKNLSDADQVHQSREDLIDKLSDVLSEILPETDNFREFENAVLEAGNELVRQTLKKN